MVKYASRFFTRSYWFAQDTDPLSFSLYPFHYFTRLAYSSSLKMEAKVFSEKLLTIHLITLHDNLEEWNMKIKVISWTGRFPYLILLFYFYFSYIMFLNKQ
jgi:hypothetical protein